MAVAHVDEVHFALPCMSCSGSVPLEAASDADANVLIDAWLDGRTLYRCTICRAMPGGPKPRHLDPAA